MDAALTTEETKNFEIIKPDEFMSRLEIEKSTLQLWRSKGWLVPRRHFVKYGKTVRYFWCKDTLLEMHDIANADTTQQPPDDVSSKPSALSTDERVNWDY